MRVVFDLDGTLADGSHREHFIVNEEGKKDWDAFFEACDGDSPHRHVFEVFGALVHSGHEVEIWSGRGEGNAGSVREKSEAWLTEHFGMNRLVKPFAVRPWARLRMRPHGDYRDDRDLKRGWLEEARAANAAPELVFDDRQKVVDMWRAEGVPCFQVAPGDF